MKKIVHIITGLNNGGAEMMLYKLLQSMNKQSLERQYDLLVISMLDKGIMGEKIERLGIPVYTLNINRVKNLLISIPMSIRLCKDADIIQTWMYHANLFGFVSNMFLKKKMIWGIRRGMLNPSIDKPLTIFIAKLCAKLSGRIDAVVYCANNSKTYHEEVLKYDSNKSVVIPNGFELEKYQKDLIKSEDFRSSLGIRPDTILIAFIGRYHAVKGYANFCKALNLLDDCMNGNCMTVFVGTGAGKENQELMQLIKDNGLEGKTVCLGRREDVPTILSAADLLVSASYTEAFSNVIGEAMACETPCVVTDVGDSAYIIGDTGIPVKNNNPDVLAKGILEMINKSKSERTDLGRQARNRVKKLFDIEVVVKEYEKLYD